jgi:hypothetical protein
MAGLVARLKFTWATLDGPAEPLLQAAIAAAKARAVAVRRAVLRIGKLRNRVVGACGDHPYGNGYADGVEFRKGLSVNDMHRSPRPRNGLSM